MTRSVYFYSAAEVGLKELPPGHMRLAGWDETRDPGAADVFVLQPSLNNFSRDQVYNLPHLKGNESRHVFWNLSENMGRYWNLPALIIRADATADILAHDPTTFAWPWPVEDLYRPQPQDFDYDVCFQGWAATPLTTLAALSVQNTKLKAHLSVHRFFFGYHDTDPAYAHLRKSFIDTLSRSRLSLVPCSIPSGVVRYRFYEAMSMGRVPVHLCDGRALPFADRIDYERCSIHIPESEVEFVGHIISDWLNNHGDDEIRAMGEYGRAAWDRWLNPAKWDSLFAEVAQEWSNGKQK